MTGLAGTTGGLISRHGHEPALGSHLIIRYLAFLPGDGLVEESRHGKTFTD